MSARRGCLSIVVVSIVALFVMSGLAVTGVHALEATADLENPVVIVKSAGGPKESNIVRTWTCTDSAFWHHWIVNSGLKSLSLDIYEKGKGKQVPVFSTDVEFAEVNAYPSGTVYLGDLWVNAGKVYRFVFEPNGRAGASAEYFHELAGPTPPVALFQYSGAGLTIRTDASASYDPDGSIVRYDWSWGDGGTGTGIIGTHTYAEWMAPTVTLTVTDDQGLVNSVSKTFPIWPFIICGFTEDQDGGPIPDCAVVVTDLRTMSSLTTVSGTEAFYQVDFNRIANGWTLGDVVRIAATTESMSGSIDVVLSENLVYLLVNVTLQGPIPPVAAFSYSTFEYRIFVDATISHDPDGTIVNYTWAWGDGAVTFGETSWHDYPFSGTRYVTLTVLDNDGLTNWSKKNMPPAPPYTIVGYTYGPDGTTALTDCAVVITNLRTGGFVTTTSDPSYGVYIIDLNTIPGSWEFGDTVRVTATKDALAGSSDGVVIPDVGYIQVDVILY